MPDLTDPRITRPGERSVSCQVVSASAAIRKTPDPGSEIATQALHGEVVDIFHREGAFGRAQCRRDRYVGWVEMEAIAIPALPPTHKIGALRTIAFTKPDVKSPVRMRLTLGALLTATGRRQGAWMEFDHAGWIHDSHIHLLDRFENDPVAIARRYLEAPYLWGGRESNGIDCSGLTQQAFEACGVLIPRDTDMQAAWAGDPVDPGALQRGDLVFWDGHVGIMASADTLLHANAHHMMVAEEPLEAAAGRLAPVAGPVTGARRIDLGRARGSVEAWLKG
ncbi:MAG: NlpC/P60 family protein [Hyphomonas sp.]